MNTPDSPEAGDDPAPAAAGERVAKWLARAGAGSRRDVERWIAEKRVKVDGTTIDTPATFVTAAHRIEIDGQRIAAPERARLWLYHKPVGQVVTARDPEGRPTVFDHLPRDLPRLVSIGRLDIASEGLLLLTNDGGLSRQLELPANGFERRYRARVHGSIDQTRLDRLMHGVEIEGVRYGPIKARLERQQRSNMWITVSLQEGKNREVRRVMDFLGLGVNRLIRIGFGPFNLDALPEGAVIEASARQVDVVTGAPGNDASGRKPGWARPKPTVKTRPGRAKPRRDAMRDDPARGGMPREETPRRGKR